MLIGFIILAALALGVQQPQGENPPLQEAPVEACLRCHGKLKITTLSSADRRLLMMPHPDDEKIPLKSDDPEFRKKLYVDDYWNPSTYLASAHGKLACVECHQDVTLPNHRIRRDPVDCRQCHEGPWDDFKGGVHHRAVDESDPRAVDCYSCHGLYHTMLLKDNPGAPVHPANVVSTCGGCHEDYLKSYRQTYHGIFHRLGNLDAARCMSCHDNHLVLSADDIRSTIHPDNLPGTCRKCHEGASDRFALFRPHLDPFTDEAQPFLYCTAWFMRILLVGILALFGLHALLWFLRSLPDLAWRMGRGKVADAKYRMRFAAFHRVVHLLLIITFTGLCVTGIPLSFSEHEWLRKAVQHLGGLNTLRSLHRLFALLTLLYGVMHLAYLWRRRRERIRSGEGSFFFGPESLVPRWKDFADFKDQCLWFVGLGPRPRFDRWTYMEKFDYWAVFWGVLTLGLSGLILWFPLVFSRFLPGWFFNWSKILHGEEALLAILYVFSIHFFNVHLRPLKFPMDPSMFTGRESMAHLDRERPEESSRMPDEGGGSTPFTTAASKGLRLAAYLFGFAMMITGFLILGGVIAALLSGP